MNIDEQVNYLMRGAEYGDQQVFDAMADELRERLIESEKNWCATQSLLWL